MGKKESIRSSHKILKSIQRIKTYIYKSQIYTNTMNNYFEDPVTISLYPMEMYDEDLTPDCGVEIDEKCEEIYEACKGWGTSEKRLIEAIGNTSGEERKLIALRYEEMHDKNLRKVMKSECGNSHFGEALQYLALGPVETECRMLKKAVDGLGANKVMMYSILCGRSNEDMELLKKTYYKEYTDDLVSRMSSEVGGDMKKILLSAVQVRKSVRSYSFCLFHDGCCINIYQLQFCLPMIFTFIFHRDRLQKKNLIQITTLKIRQEKMLKNCTKWVKEDGAPMKLGWPKSSSCLHQNI